MLRSALIFLTIFSCGVALARPEIIIPSEVEISQREILRLSDVAQVRAGSDKLLAIMDAIVIRTDARELLLSQHLDANEVMIKVRSEMRDNEDLKKINPILRVPSKIKVSFSTTPISKQEVERKIQNILQSRCHDCEYKVSVQSTPFPTQGVWDLDYSQLAPRGGFLIPLRDGDRRNIKWISGNIRVSKLTPVTTRMILQGERVQPSDVQLAMTDVTFAKDAPIGLSEIQGQVAARSIPLGNPLWISDLKREPAAQRGQVIKALVGDEGFEISVNVMAEENGFVGDVIKLKNMETQKPLSGMIVEKGVVKLQ